MSNITKPTFFFFIFVILLVSGCDSESIQLKMENSFSKEEIVKVSVETSKNISTGFETFEVYQLVDGEEKFVNIYGSNCVVSCSSDEVCNSSIACAPVPTGCFDLDKEFEWDQTVYKTRKVECSGEEKECFFTEEAEPGNYKLVFEYSENCVNKEVFEDNDIKTVEKRFEIR